MCFTVYYNYLQAVTATLYEEKDFFLDKKTQEIESRVKRLEKNKSIDYG